MLCEDPSSQIIPDHLTQNAKTIQEDIKEVLGIMTMNIESKQYAHNLHVWEWLLVMLIQISSSKRLGCYMSYTIAGRKRKKNIFDIPDSILSNLRLIPRLK